MLTKSGVNTSIQVDFCINEQKALQLIKDSYSSNFNYKLILTDFNIDIIPEIKAYYDNFKVEKDTRPLIVGFTNTGLNQRYN